MKIITLNSLKRFFSNLSTLLNNKVDKVSGKGLSTNDFTSTYKSKLDGIATGANKYTLPTASSSTLGGVKTTSSVSSSTGYTACPIINGVPYYKDTNTTYSTATTSSNGLMSSTDKKQIETNKSDIESLKNRPDPIDYGMGGQCKYVSGDLNTCCGSATGFYMGYDLTNAPTTDWYYIIHLVHNDLYCRQIIYGVNSGESKTRLKQSNVWSAWF